MSRAAPVMTAAIGGKQNSPGSSGALTFAWKGVPEGG